MVQLKSGSTSQFVSVDHVIELISGSWERRDRGGPMHERRQDGIFPDVHGRGGEHRREGQSERGTALLGYVTCVE